MLQAPENYLLVEIEKRFQDEIFSKYGKMKIDTTYAPEEYTTLNGKVVSAPVKVRSDRHRTIMGTVLPGDEVWFSYGVIFDYLDQPEEENFIYKNLVIHEGKEYWKVEMGEVFCRVRDRKIEMMTDNVLMNTFHVEPLSEQHGNLYVGEQKEDNTGIVKAMPPNIKLSCNVGDRISFESRYVQKYNILGGEHYIIPSRRVLAKM